MSRRYDELIAAVVKQRKEARDRFDACARLANALLISVRAFLGLERDEDQLITCRPLEGEYDPKMIHSTLGAVRRIDRGVYEMGLLVRIVVPSQPPASLLYALRISEVGGSLYRVRIAEDAPEISVDAADPSTFNAFAEAICDETVRFYGGEVRPGGPAALGPPN
jgi:hypothetical protein